MTNHMAEVAQMLGVELEEVFKVTDDDSGKYHNYYKFTEKKGIEVSEDNVKWEADTAGTLVLKWLLIGVARIIKLPVRNITCHVLLSNLRTDISIITGPMMILI